MMMYSDGPSLCSNTHKVVGVFWLALTIICYFFMYLVGYYLAIVIGADSPIFTLSHIDVQVSLKSPYQSYSCNLNKHHL